MYHYYIIVDSGGRDQKEERTSFIIIKKIKKLATTRASPILPGNSCFHYSSWVQLPAACAERVQVLMKKDGPELLYSRIHS